MKTIELTLTIDYKKVTLNINNIDYFTSSSNYDNYTSIYMNDKAITVQEDYETVLNLISKKMQ
jgi:hypothetical protein